MFSYTYSEVSDFPTGGLNSNALVFEINKAIQDGIFQIAFVKISQNPDPINNPDPDRVDIVFAAELSDAEKTALDDLVVDHDNTLVMPSSYPANIVNIPEVSPVPPMSTENTMRTYVFSVDWTRRETWYHDALKISGEALGVGDGVETVFNLANAGNGKVILNLTNGYLTSEEFTFAPGDPYPTGLGAGYTNVIALDGVPQTEIKSYQPGVGDYSIDHSTGAVTFNTPPANGVVIAANYWYVPDTALGSFIIKPPTGKKWIIDTVEAQFSKDIIMNDSILQNQFVNDVPISPINLEYHRIGSFFDFTFGSFPEIPPIGGSPRGYTQPTIILRWDFSTRICLSDTNKDSLKIWLKNGIEFGGERATLAWYAIEQTI